SIADALEVARRNRTVRVSDHAAEAVRASRSLKHELIAQEIPIYGVTTGFGDSAHRQISPDKAAKLQQNILRFMGVGTGPIAPPEVTRQVLMKHLVCACTGLPRQDLEWLLEFEHATPASEWKLLGTFTPTSKFGEVSQYSNLMASAAGYIGGWVLDPKRELGAANAALERVASDPTLG
ncbi:hypothetical protein B4Q13_17300, partial [Lacticaseibacillus rhamnosus]